MANQELIVPHRLDLREGAAASRTGIIANPVFAIPAGAANHEVEAEATFSEDVRIWTMHPHMHLRGKDMTYTATYPDGRSEIVLKVPKFDFGWQTDYWPSRSHCPRDRSCTSAPTSITLRRIEPTRSDEGRALGRSDVGGDDDRLLHVHRGGTAGTFIVAIVQVFIYCVTPNPSI